MMWVALLLGIVTFTGQWGREPLAVDDFREIEVAREMSQEGSVVVPHLAGLPFVEKPPGFPAVLAGAFRLVGHPSIRVARLISAGFAALFITATVLLGRSMLGPAGGLTAGAILAFSPLFLGTSHTVLLDNALAAAMAFVLYFGWRAFSEDDPKGKTWEYAAAGFTLGVAFLVKGLVGPALAGSSLLLFLGMSRRWDELRHIFRPIPILAFLLPVAFWLVPFVHQADPELIHEFFVLNHVGRFTSAYESHPRPVYFYAVTLTYLFAPGISFLPSAIRQAWKGRGSREGLGELYGLAFALGPLLLLTLSRAKDSVYLLPAYPAFALLAAGQCLRLAESHGRVGGIAGVLLAMAAVAAAAVTVTAAAVRGPLSPSLWMAGAAVLGLSAIVVWFWRGRNALGAGLSIASLVTITVVLFYSGPLARVEVDRKPWRETVWELATATRGRRLFLHAPDDILRGGMGFYRDETAQEVRRPGDLVSELAADSGAVALVVSSTSGLPAAFLEEAADRQVNLVEERRCPYRRDTWLVLISARQGEEAHTRQVRRGS